MKKILVKAVFGFIFKTIDIILKGALKIAAAIGENEALYPSLKPKLEDGILIINALQEAITNDDGSILSRTIIEERADPVRELIRGWASQVTKDANGSLEVLLKSGFQNIKQREARPAAATPTKVKVKDGKNSGSVVIKSNVVKYADKYQYRYTTKINPTEADFIILNAGVRTLTIEELTEGIAYYFSCRAYGRHNVSDWCDDTKWLVR